MVGLGDVLLHFMHLLGVDVRVRVLGTVDHASLQALIDLGEAHLARIGAQGLELLIQHGGGLYAELQTTGVFRLTQFLVGGQLLHAVVPVGQAGDVLVFHRAQQLLAGIALLEAVNRLDVVEQERQVEHLNALRVMLELGQRRSDQLYVAQQQRFHFLAVAEQGRVRVNLDFHLAGQTLFNELLEHDGTLAFRGVFGNYVGELDQDRVGGLGQACDTEGQSTGERCGSQFEHCCVSSCCG